MGVATLDCTASLAKPLTTRNCTGNLSLNRPLTNLQRSSGIRLGLVSEKNGDENQSFAAFKPQTTASFCCRSSKVRKCRSLSSSAQPT